MADALPKVRFFNRRRPVHPLPMDRANRRPIVFLTVCTGNRRPTLASEAMHHHLVMAWQMAGHWLVGRYVIMPDHVHLFCGAGTIPPNPLDAWVRYWKALVTKRHGCGEGMLWQTDFWDTQIRRREAYEAKWEYVRNNPVRAGLVQESIHWPYQGEMHHLRWRE